VYSSWSLSGSLALAKTVSSLPVGVHESERVPGGHGRRISEDDANTLTTCGGWLTGRAAFFLLKILLKR
jgi:hypothetical protein